MVYEEKLAGLIGSGLQIKQIEANGYRVNYVVAGSGRPLILLHGLDIGWGQWYKNIGELAKHFTVYAIDLPGSGGSTKFDFARTDLSQALVETVLQFVFRLGLSNVSIIGHSVGAWVAMRLAIEHNDFVDKLVLSNPLGLVNYVPLRHLPLTFLPIAKILSLVVVKPTRDNMAKFLASVCYNKISVEDILVDYFHESINRERLVHPFMVMSRLFRPFRLRNEFVLTKDLGRIMAKTLIISGDKDFLVPPRKISKVLDSFKNAKIEVMKNAGHVPFIERSVEFNNVVLGFLSLE